MTSNPEDHRELGSVHIPGVRFVKVRKLSRGDVYVILLPDLITTGFHASFHPGEFHFKVPTAQGAPSVPFTPADLLGLLSLILGTMRPWIRQPASGHLVESTVFPGSGVKTARGSPWESTIDVDSMTRGAWAFTVSPPQTLLGAIKVLRAEGALNPGDFVLGKTRATRETTIFAVVDPKSLSSGGTPQAAHSGLGAFRDLVRSYGGLMLTLGDRDYPALNRVLKSQSPALRMIAGQMRLAFRDELTDRRGRVKGNPLSQLRRGGLESVKRNPKRTL